MSRLVLYDFAGDPKDPEQLSVHAGEVVVSGEDAGDGWIYITNANRKRGVVPASYLGETQEIPVTPSQQEDNPAQPSFTNPASEEAGSFPPEGTVQQSSAAQEPVAAASSDSRLEKYERMKRAGLPEGAIRNAMQRDGVDSTLFFGAGSASDNGSSEAQDTEATLPSVSSSGFVRSNDPTLDKYKRMEKTGLPEGAIRNAMARDGVDASLMYGGASETPKKLVSIGKPSASSPASLEDALKHTKLSSTPATPPNEVGAQPSPPKSEASPFDEVKKRATERQKRLEATGGLLTGEATGGASWSPPDKSQWRPNLRKAEPPIRDAYESAEASKPDWSANLKKTTSGNDVKSDQSPKQPDWTNQTLKKVPDAGVQAKKRTQDEAEMVSAAEKDVVKPPTLEKQPYACEEYHLDTTAARFGDCRCGHPKQAHQGKDTTLKETVPSEHATGSERQERPCESYRVDVSAVRFGDCKCGHPKSAHGSPTKKGIDEPSEAGKISMKTAKQPTACDRFQLDMSAAFDTCKCGHAKADHAGHKATTVASAEVPEKISKPATKADQPCAVYQVDLAAKEFGVCKCGFSKAEHGRPRKLSSDVPAATSVMGGDGLKKRSPKPCGRFQLDMAAGTFNTCTCGHPKTAHGRKSSHSDDDNDVVEEKAENIIVQPLSQTTTSVSEEAASSVETQAALVEETPTAAAQEVEKITSPIVASTLRKSLSASPPQPAPRSPKVETISEVAQTPAAPEALKPAATSPAPSSKQASDPPTPVAFVPRRAAPPPPGLDGEPRQVVQEPAFVPRRTAPPPPAAAPATMKAPPRAAPPRPTVETPSQATPSTSAPRRPAPSIPSAPVISPAGSAAFPAAPQHQPVTAPSAELRKPAPPGISVAQASSETAGVPWRAAPPPPTQNDTYPSRIPAFQQGMSSTGMTHGATGMAYGQAATLQQPTGPPAYMQQPPYATPPVAYGSGPQPYGVPAAAGASSGGPMSYRPPLQQQSSSSSMAGYAPQPAGRPPLQQQVSTSFMAPGYAPQSAGWLPYQQQAQSTAMAPPVPAAIAAGNWSCPRCTYENAAGSVECLMCELKRPSTAPVSHPVPIAARPAPPPPSAPPSQAIAQNPTTMHWNCTRCTFLNAPNRVKCEMCDYPRPTLYASQATLVQQQQQPPGAGGGANPFQAFW